MKGRQIVLDHYAGREAAALLVDGRLEDLLIDGEGVRVGAIYRARADRPMKGQGGMFLSTPDGPVFATPELDARLDGWLDAVRAAGVKV